MCIRDRVWDLACRRGRDYGAFVAVAGAFWEPLPEQCTGGPADLLHIHGTADRTVPMAGRAIGERWRQGDVLRGLGVLRALDGCPAEPGATASLGGMDCRGWWNCASGRRLELCEHPGAHAMPEGWVALAHAWARKPARRTQGG
jgi:polyhydroxybutyrate depolymerase